MHVNPTGVKVHGNSPPSQPSQTDETLSYDFSNRFVSTRWVIVPVASPHLTCWPDVFNEQPSWLPQEPINTDKHWQTLTHPDTQNLNTYDCSEWFNCLLEAHKITEMSLWRWSNHNRSFYDWRHDDVTATAGGKTQGKLERINSQQLSRSLCNLLNVLLPCCSVSPENPNMNFITYQLPMEEKHWRLLWLNEAERTRLIFFCIMCIIFIYFTSFHFILLFIINFFCNSICITFLTECEYIVNYFFAFGSANHLVCRRSCDNNSIRIFLISCVEALQSWWRMWKVSCAPASFGDSIFPPRLLDFSPNKRDIQSFFLFTWLNLSDEFCSDIQSSVCGSRRITQDYMDPLVRHKKLRWSSCWGVHPWVRFFYRWIKYESCFSPGGAACCFTSSLKPVMFVEGLLRVQGFVGNVPPITSTSGSRNMSLSFQEVKALRGPGRLHLQAEVHRSTVM